jgi:sugar phosphate isomerase/epimerase
MNRPVTLFTGQWADLSFEDVCKKVADWGYDGVEIACWGDHMDVKQAAEDPQYVSDKQQMLEKYGLKCWALGNHLTGQCVGDLPDPRLDAFVPAEVRGDAEAIKAWAIQQMKYTAQAAANMGCSTVTGFMGSPIWKYLYSFPPTTEEMVKEGYQYILDIWSPILDEFDKHKVTFALEVHPSEIAYDYYSAQRLMKVFNNRKALGLNFDPSHLIWQGINPVIFLQGFADKIYHVHMKDAAVTLDGKSGLLGSHLPFGDRRRGWNFRSLGHGDVNFTEIIRELNVIGYNGPLSVEWEDNGMDREFGAKESAAFVQKINFSPSEGSFEDNMK